MSLNTKESTGMSTLKITLLTTNLNIQTYEKNVSFILRFDMTKITRFRIIYS